jgi:hypothetical protein
MANNPSPDKGVVKLTLSIFHRIQKRVEKKQGITVTPRSRIETIYPSRPSQEQFKDEVNQEFGGEIEPPLTREDLVDAKTFGGLTAEIVGRWI